MKESGSHKSIVKGLDPKGSSQRTGNHTQVKGNGRKAKAGSQKSMIVIFLFVGMLLIAHSSLLVAQNTPAKPEEKAAAAKMEEKAVKAEEKKQSGAPADREEALRKEEERLKALKKELDEKIEKYTRLLAKMEEALKSMETAKGERYEHLIKAYEAMPNEEAAARLATLDEPTAVKIIGRMKSKKAGAVMASMEPRKAASLTEGMMSIAQKFPTK
jgi:flagellar motility protein MotE (MotC chaperone)